MAWHSEGVSFKLRPRHSFPDAAELQKTQEKMTRAWLRTFLWVESLGLNENFSNAEHYARSRARLFPEMEPWRRLALHLRDWWKRGASLASWFDYPRAALQRALTSYPEPHDLEAAASRDGTANRRTEPTAEVYN